MGNRNEMAAMTQKDEVVMYLNKYGSITALEGVLKLFIIDLAGVIRDLRKEMRIDDEWVYKKNIYGRPIRFKRYFLVEDDQKSFFDRIRLFK